MSDTYSCTTKIYTRRVSGVKDDYFYFITGNHKLQRKLFYQFVFCVMILMMHCSFEWKFKRGQSLHAEAYFKQQNKKMNDRKVRIEAKRKG